MLCSLFRSVLCSVLCCCALLLRCVVLCCVMLCCVVLCCLKLSCVPLLLFSVLFLFYYSVLFCSVLFYSVLFFSFLFRSVSFQVDNQYFDDFCFPCREKTRLLLIKQQQSITLVFINIVMLLGFQGLESKVGHPPKRRARDKACSNHCSKVENRNMREIRS